MAIETTKLKAAESINIDFLDFSSAKVEYNRLIDAWGTIQSVTTRNRELRYQKFVDSQDLRASGTLQEDEMFNPVHIIDTNIRREQPQFVNYLTQSRRSIIFTSKDQRIIDGIEKLEVDFTNKARYLAWEIPFIHCIDGAQTHGWDSIEVRFDVSYPGNFCFHHVGHSNLIFAFDSEDITVQEVILQREQISATQMEMFVKTKGWNAETVEEVKNIYKKTSSSNYEDVNCWIYKVFFKKEGIILETWMYPECKEYFVAPSPLWLGIRDTTVPPTMMSSGEMDYPKVPETEFPHTICKYIESEDPIITNLIGRAKMDEPVQEAVSALSSSMINSAVRSSMPMAAPAKNNLNSNPTAIPKATDVIIKKGAMFDSALDVFYFPPPEPGMVQIAQYITTQNQQEQSQVNFSVLNRKDSGKTATEVNAATQKAGELGSVQIILLSIFVRQAYAKAWRIYQSRVIQKKIEISTELFPLFGTTQQQQIPQPRTYKPDQLNPLAMVPIEQPPQIIETVTPIEYIIKSSGDVDVVQRQENLQRKLQAWPVIVNTPIAMEFLKDILRASFPEDAGRYCAIIDKAQTDQTAQLKNMLGKVSNVINATVTDEATGKIKPEFQNEAPQLEQLAKNVSQILGQNPQDNSGQAQPTSIS